MGDLGAAAVQVKNKSDVALFHRDEAVPGSPTLPFPFYPNDTVEDVVRRYEKMFPMEAAAYASEAAEQRRSLLYSNGMTRGKTAMKTGLIPPFLMRAMMMFDINWWSDKGNVQAFFFVCPGLRVAPHRVGKVVKVA